MWIALLALAPLPAAAQGSDVICRSAEFWGSRAGREHGRINIAQQVIDAAGGLQVCGQNVTKTSRLDSPYVKGFGLTSALEGLCVRVQSVRERQLYRQLLATSLNCAISGADDDAECDAIVQQTVEVEFSDCNALCAGQPGDGSPTVSRCIAQLRCFNNGGRIVAGGRCALGFCAEDHDRLCAGDFDPCPLVEGHHQSCKRFPGDCHRKRLCNQSIGVCPATARRSSTQACEEAALNSCTIDSCP